MLMGKKCVLFQWVRTCQMALRAEYEAVEVKQQPAAALQLIRNTKGLKERRRKILDEASFKRTAEN